MKVVIVLVVSLVFAALGHMIGYIGSGQGHAQYFSNGAPATTGRIIARRPEQHRTVIYSYQVDGIPFTGIGRESDVISGHGEAGIGTEVVVHYDPDRPTDSMIGDPAIVETINNRIIAVASILMALFGAVLSTLGLVVYSKAKAPKSQ